MAFFLDTALASELGEIARLGLIQGVTTNPALLREAEQSPEDAIWALCDAVQGTVFYQLNAPSLELRREEAQRLLALRPGRVGLKIPCTPDNLGLARELNEAGHTVGITTIFSAAQVALAVESGARYVLPYVNRSTRLLGDGVALVREMRGVIDACGAATQIIAASLKSPDEAIAALLAGAHHLTVSPSLFEAMGTHDLSYQAVEEFAEPSDDEN